MTIESPKGGLPQPEEVDCIDEILSRATMTQEDKRLFIRLIRVQSGHLANIERSLNRYIEESARRFDHMEHMASMAHKALFGTEEDPSTGIVNVHIWMCRAVRILGAVIVGVATSLAFILHQAKTLGWL